MPVNLILYSGAVGSFSNRHSARELKYRNLSLRSQYHNDVFVHCFFSRNSGFLFVLPLTVFQLINITPVMGPKTQKLFLFLLPHQNMDSNMVI